MRAEPTGALSSSVAGNSRPRPFAAAASPFSLLLGEAAASGDCVRSRRCCSPLFPQQFMLLKNNPPPSPVQAKRVEAGRSWLRAIDVISGQELATPSFRFGVGEQDQV